MEISSEELIEIYREFKSIQDEDREAVIEIMDAIYSCLERIEAYTKEKLDYDDEISF